jgi:predicted O-methyltransferase YrrM
MRSAIHFVDGASSSTLKTLRHPFFRWAGLRPTLAQHTQDEHDALRKHARGAGIVVEIGVAEGASAAALREVMSSEGSLYLVDPYHLSRVPALNFLKRAAKRVVESVGSARTIWLEDFSQNVAQDWSESIDFLLIDGDHNEKAVERDWTDWSPFVKASGVVAFHDARQFPNGWTTPNYGPVSFVNRAFRQGEPQSWRILDEVDSLVFVKRADSHLVPPKSGVRE